MVVLHPYILYIPAEVQWLNGSKHRKMNKVNTYFEQGCVESV